MGCTCGDSQCRDSVRKDGQEQPVSFQYSLSKTEQKHDQLSCPEDCLFICYRCSFSARQRLRRRTHPSMMLQSTMCSREPKSLDRFLQISLVSYTKGFVVTYQVRLVRSIGAAFATRMRCTSPSSLTSSCVPHFLEEMRFITLCNRACLPLSDYSRSTVNPTCRALQDQHMLKISRVNIRMFSIIAEWISPRTAKCILEAGLT